MNNQTTPSPTRVRIYSHVTQSRFLHVEDTLAIGKLRLFAGNYRKGQGMDTCAHAFVDAADARVIFGALARGEQSFSHREYKGTPPQNGKDAISRVLSVAVKGENVYVELKSGPGKLTPTGVITPNGLAKVAVNVIFKLYEARRMATAVLAYLRAWDVLRMMMHHQIVGKPASYPLVATASENNGAPPKTARSENRSAQGNGSNLQQSRVPNGRPMTRKGNGQSNGKIANPANASPVVKQPLKYGNGTLVDGKNLMEVQTYRQYFAERQSVPASKTMLLDYYRQRMQAVADLTEGINPKRAFADQ